MAKCSAHSGRGRAPKDCADCAAGKLVVRIESVSASRISEAAFFAVETIAEQAAAQFDSAAVAPVAKRRKRVGYVVRYEDEPTTPRHTSDGKTWLDPDGNPPHEGADGKLTEPFVFQLGNGAREQWFPPLRLPMPPAVLAAFNAEQAEIFARKHKAAK